MQLGMGLWYLLPMLTRLKVDGFKNLVGVDVRFGPFNCIAGANGVGKSNLFDAIRFLSLTAGHPLAEAARRVRDEQGGNSDVRGLFHRIGGHWAKKMTFEVEMVVPTKAEDDLGQLAIATWSYLTYKLEIRLREGGQSNNPQHPMEIVTEELGVAKGEVGFRRLHSWAKAIGGGLLGLHDSFGQLVDQSGSSTPPFIVTVQTKAGANIKLRSEGQETVSNQATAIRPPKSLLSAASAGMSPTAFCAQQELKSWLMLQLDPGALRLPDEFNSPAKLEANGRRLAATLARLTNPAANSLHDSPAGGAPEGKVFGRLTNRLAGLVKDISGIRLDRDEKRSLNTVLFRMRDGTEFPARDMSDGTLRLLALALLELDPEAPRVICLEEPENGVHPDRLPAIVRLLQDIALDPMEPLDETNLVRQVIVNTHSPSVVMAVPEDSLIVARSVPGTDGERVIQRVEFAGISGTWRAKLSPTVPAVSKGELLSYLDPAGMLTGDPESTQPQGRVVDRTDLRDLLKE